MQDLEITDYHSSLQKLECNGDEMVLTFKNGTDYAVPMSSIVTFMAAQWDADQMNALVGMYSPRPDIALTSLESNKVINANGVKVAKSGWAIAEFTAQLGNVYLFNPGATAADVCVFAEKIDKVETRGVDYAYTYDSKGNPLTAKATYNGATHSYTYTNTYTTQDGNETLSVVITDDQTGKTVEYLPQTYQTTVGAYQPMVRLNENAELPKDGYCRFVSNFQTSDSIRIAVSYKVDSANLTMKVVRSGMVASMCTQLSKINQKVDELAKYTDKTISRLEVYSLEDTSITLDNVNHKIYKGKLNVFTGFTTLYIETEGSPRENSDCITYFKLSGNVTTTGLGFLYNCEVIDLSEAYITTQQAYLLQSCRKVKKLKLNGKQTRSVGKIAYSCLELEELDLSGWSAHDFIEMFCLAMFCKKLTKLDLTGFDFSKVKSRNYAKFESLDELVNLYLPESYFAIGTELFDMSALKKWEGASVNYSLITHIYDRVANGMPTATIKLSDKTYYQLEYNNQLDSVTSKGYTVTK